MGLLSCFLAAMACLAEVANKTTLYFVLFKPECLTIGMECARVMAVSR